MSKKIGGVDPDDEFKLLQTLHHIKKTGVPVAIHAEDRDTITKNTKKMELTGRSDLEAYAQAHPSRAEEKAISKVLQHGKETGIHIHICHLSTFSGLKIIQDAKKSGSPLTCEVTPHHLLLPLSSAKHYGNLAIVDPPLRTKVDAKALWHALQGGSIDILASDHAPHAMNEKENMSIWSTSPGIPGLETLLPLFLTQVNNGIISLADLVRLTSENPARIFDLKNRGSLDPGYKADITVVDINKKFEIDSSEFHSKAKQSPFEGWRVKGQPIKTFVNGRLVMEEGEIVAKPGTGQIIVTGIHAKSS
jgi:dihydroorotase